MQPEEEGFVGFRREGGEGVENTGVMSIWSIQMYSNVWTDSFTTKGVVGEKESSMRIIWNSSRNVRIIHNNWIGDGPNYECACTCVCQCICMGVRESCACVRMICTCMYVSVCIHLRTHIELRMVPLWIELCANLKFLLVSCFCWIYVDDLLVSSTIYTL